MVTTSAARGGEPGARWRALTSVSLVVAVLDCVYLSWRYLGLRLGRLTPGTGLCSWSEGIDCDKVLMTPEANAFFVPNALLGLGVFGGLALWWFVARPWLGPERLSLILAVLAGWLGLATLFTLYFFYLLVQLPALCPFCPWNHAFTWAALAGALGQRRASAQARSPLTRADLDSRAWAMIALCISWFAVIQIAWLVWLRPLHVS